jgi:hypothetical protein
MSSSTMDNIDENIIYKPGTFHYQDVPINKRKQLFEDRQKELNPCLKVRNFTRLTMIRLIHYRHKKKLVRC